MKTNPQYEEMLRAAVERLQERDPEDIAKKAGIMFDKENSVFSFKCFNDDIKVSLPDYTVEPCPDMWLHLSLLQYLYFADGTPVIGKYIPLSDFKNGGMVRGSSFRKEIEEIVQRKIGKLDIPDLKEAVEKAGGTLTQGKGDVSALFYFMPNYPMLVNIWGEDDEFPASCNILFDSTAEHYLEVEAAGTAAFILLNRIESNITF